MTTLDWETFAPLFGTWANRFKPFFDQGGFDPIYKKLKEESKRGKRIAPLSSEVFNCFAKTPYDSLKVIMIGMCPYHSFVGSMSVADGLLMSCSKTGKLQPSLYKFYNALKEDVYNGDALEGVFIPDLSYLAEQGVLLLNAGLTVEANKPGSHNEMWEPFMKFLFQEVIVTSGMPVVFLGKEASKLKRYLAPFTWMFELTHPAYAAYKNEDWDSEKTFTKVNKILEGNNHTEIRWISSE